MSSLPLTECPECKGTLKRIIGTGAGPIFKGSGFYQTDYKSKSTQSNKSEKPDTTQSGADTKTGKDDKK
jgi:predicted nucleic acid-binding Zn ribbon protein